MIADTLPRPLGHSPQLAAVWLMLLVVLGLLSLAAAEGMRRDCQTEDQPLLDGFGMTITNGFGQPILIGRKHRCDLIAMGGRVPLPAWSEAF